jgi:hypothetical protein
LEYLQQLIFKPIGQTHIEPPLESVSLEGFLPASGVATQVSSPSGLDGRFIYLQLPPPAPNEAQQFVLGAFTPAGDAGTEGLM